MSSCGRSMGNMVPPKIEQKSCATKLDRWAEFVLNSLQHITNNTERAQERIILGTSLLLDNQLQDMLN